MFGRLRKKLKHKDVYAATMRDWIMAGVEQMCSQNLQTLELSTMTTELAEGTGLQADMLFITRRGLRENPELDSLCATRWKEFIKDYNVLASIPKVSGQGSEVYLLAAFDDPWAALTPETVLEGVFDTVAVDFYEDVKKLVIRRTRRL